MNNITRGQIRLIAHLLQQAADEFSNHGCNDFLLTDVPGLTEKEMEEIKQDFAIWMQSDDPQYVYNGEYLIDWLAMLYCKDLVLQTS